MPTQSRIASPAHTRSFQTGAKLCGLILLLLALAASPALAQSRSTGGFFPDLLNGLFGGQSAAPRPVHRMPHPHPVAPRPQAHTSSRGAPHQAATVKPAEAAPKPDAPPPSFFVAVIGDSQAQMLAQGLKEAFADDSRVAILNKARQDTGLVRDDFFDWRVAAKSLLEGPQHIDMAVIQIGINDNQKLHLGDNDLEPLSKPFNEIYAKRVEEIAQIFQAKSVPLIWAGLPIMRSDKLSSAALVFNDIYRQYAGAAGARYIDLWEAFADEDSKYQAIGPDVNGAITRLRIADGVHFNKAGARKAAHFIEADIRHALEAAKPPLTPTTPEAPASATAPAPDQNQAALPPEATPQPPETPAAPAPPPEKPIAGKVAPLDEAATSPGGVLATLPAPGAPSPRPEATPPQPGRADDFSWPGK